MLVHCALSNPKSRQKILKHFMFPSAEKLYGDFFEQDFIPSHTVKIYFNDCGLTLFNWLSNSPDLTESMGHCEEKI